MLKKTILLFLFLLNAAFFIGCDDKNGSDTVYLGDDESTVAVYEGYNMPMDENQMLYSLEIGPLDISEYEQIRIITSIYSGTGLFTVSIAEFNEEGEDLGILDQFTLDTSGVDRVTNVYDVPGERIQISFSSASPGDKSISCLVYGR